MRIGYGRVSTADQHPEAQSEALEAAGCERVFTDHGVSGRKASRPELDACMTMLRSGDTLVITKLDRLGRSVRNLVDIAQVLSERGIDLVVLAQGIDTSTPTGRMLFHILASIAEFEADLVRERTTEALAFRRARGITGGRPRKLSDDQVATARMLYEAGTLTVAQIASQFDVTSKTVYRMLHRAEDFQPHTARAAS